MEIVEILKEAIQKQKPISYEYEAPDRAIGVRFGNPHAIFISTSGNVNIDIYKTGGVSSDLSKPIPGWRQYKIRNISEVTILEQEEKFEVAIGYNPTSKQYDRAIERI